MAAIGPWLLAIDTIALWIFTLELGLKLTAWRTRFFRDGWNIFDLVIVAIAWLPAAGPLAVLRALRIMRILRLVAIVPQMRTVVGALFRALPGMGSILAVLLLVYYVAAVMATKLFGAAFPDWFGNIGASMFSLFQVMTLESWSMGIVRPVMELFPLAWAFFLPFILLTTFTVLNLFIGIVVDAIQRQHEAEHAEDPEPAHEDTQTQLLAEIRALRDEVAALRTDR